MISFIVSCILFYVVPFAIYRFPNVWKSFGYSAEDKKLEMFPSGGRSWTYYVLVVAIYTTTISMTLFIVWKVFRRLPVRLKYEIYAGIDTFRLLFLVIYRKLQTLIPAGFGKPGKKSKKGCDSCEDVSAVFNDACVEAEILNFCLSLPKDSEKWALAAAIKRIFFTYQPNVELQSKKNYIWEKFHKFFETVYPLMHGKVFYF